jgi:hypothetical protein
MDLFQGVSSERETSEREAVTPATEHDTTDEWRIGTS